MTLLPHLHLSLPAGAQPSGLTSAKCVLKSGEGPFHYPPPPARPSRPHRQHLLLFLPPLCPLSLSHTLTRWQGGGIIVTRAGFMESGPMAKTKRHLSIPAGNTPPPPPPPPSTGIQGLIRYALISHIDHRRDSISPESSHRTFINGEAKNTHRAHTCKAAEDYRLESSRRLSVRMTAEQFNPGSQSAAACSRVRPVQWVTWENFLEASGRGRREGPGI